VRFLDSGGFYASGAEKSVPTENEKASESDEKERMSDIQVKPKVLVADDERVIADTLVIILNQAGFDATAVYSGEKAVELAGSLQPDMLISDVIMHDLNGIDAAITVRQILPKCKILLFSGQAATADLLDRARAQGHEFEILAKPVHPQDLLAKLKS
jgi:CheY-like chemotaxis protein